MIDFELGITRLMRQAQDIRQMVLGISAEQARWKPDSETWSILEVVNHLYDEEREDFRVRLPVPINLPQG